MNTAQVWAIVGVMAAGLATMITLVFRYLDARFNEFGARLGAIDGKLDARFEAVDARFEAVNRRIDNLDRDMQRVIERIFG